MNVVSRPGLLPKGTGKGYDASGFAQDRSFSAGGERRSAFTMGSTKRTREKRDESTNLDDLRFGPYFFSREWREVNVAKWSSVPYSFDHLDPISCTIHE